MESAAMANAKTGCRPLDHVPQLSRDRDVVASGISVTSAAHSRCPRCRNKRSAAPLPAWSAVGRFLDGAQRVTEGGSRRDPKLGEDVVQMGANRPRR